MPALEDVAHVAPSADGKAEIKLLVSSDGSLQNRLRFAVLLKRGRSGTTPFSAKGRTCFSGHAILLLTNEAE